MPPARRDRRARTEVGTRRRRITPARAVVLAVASEVVLAGVDVATGSSIVLATAYVLAPLALATLAPPRQVLAVAVLALVLSVASGAWNGFLFSTDHVVRVLLVTLAGRCAVLSAGRASERPGPTAAPTTRVGRPWRRGSRPRPSGLAPTTAPTRCRPACCPTGCPSLRAGRSTPPTRRASEAPTSAATSTTSCQSTAGHLVVLGDVTGKGIEAAALTSLVRYSARMAARFDPSPPRVLALVNQVLREQSRLSLVTAVCAFVHDDGRARG